MIQAKKQPTELEYIDPFFKSLKPRAVPVVGKEHMLRFVCDEPEWKKVIGLLTAHDIPSLKVRAKYRLFKEMENRRMITFCKCGAIIGSRVIDGFNRPWENICNACTLEDKRTDSQRVF